MSSYQEQEYSFFESLIAPWVGAYRFVDIAYVGINTSDGPRLITSRILLNPYGEIQNLKPFHFESDHVIAGRYILDVCSSDIKSILEQSKNGEVLAVNGTKISLQKEKDGHLRAYCSPIRHPFVSDGIRIPNLRISGISKHNLMTKDSNHLDVDWELKSSKEPFDNLDDLLRHCFLPTQSEIGDSTSLEIIAACPATITDKSIIADGKAVIECRIPAALDVEKIRVGYKLFRGVGIVERRESVDGSSFLWKQEDGVKTGIYQVQVGDASHLQTFISYSGIAQHQWWITDPNKRLNPRHAIHQIFDDDLEVLKRQLFKTEVDKAHMFEQAVSMLFNLVGFSISNYGRIPKLQRGPDIIAVSASGNIAVVECTLGLINENDKLAKLVQRTKLIKDKLNSAGYGHLQLQPVVVTPLSRNEIAANLEEAGKNGIAVICKEDIEGMIGQISLPLNPDKLFDEAKNLVPSMSPGFVGGMR